MARGDKFGALYWLLRKIAEDSRYAELDSGSQAALVTVVILAANPRGEFRVKHSTLAAWLGIHPKTVARHFRPIVASGLLEKSRQLRVATNGSRIETVPRYRVDPELVAKLRVSGSDPAPPYEDGSSRGSDPAPPQSGSNPAPPASGSNPAPAGTVYRSELGNESGSGDAAPPPTAPPGAPPAAPSRLARDGESNPVDDDERDETDASSSGIRRVSSSNRGCVRCGRYARYDDPLWGIGDTFGLYCEEHLPDDDDDDDDDETAPGSVEVPW